MILHLEDFKKYPDAMVDFGTVNRSFVDLAYKYKSMGIKNYFFHLVLIDKTLQGVDPYNPYLPLDVKVKIANECRINPWYFFREVFRLPSQGSLTPDRLRANRGNIGTYWLYFNHIDVALVQPRQTGKSVGADGINTYVTQIAGRKATFSLITKDHDLRGKNVQRLKDIRDLLPSYLNPFDKRKDTNNQIGLTAKLYENNVFTGVAQNDEASALNLGRGSTSESNQIDEGPFCNLIHVTMDAFLSSANAARENAAANGAFYGNIFTTTAGKLDTKEGKYLHDMFTSGMTFDERKLFDAGDQATAEKIVERHTKVNGKPMVYICLTHKQLGYTDEWIYKKMRDSNSRGDAADRDYFNRWTTGSLRSPLTTKVLEAIAASKEDATYIEITERHYCVQWYIPESEIASRLATGKYIMGNDTSEGVGKDGITMVLTDSETLEVIAGIRITETNLYSFIEWFTGMLIKYPNIICIPERKSQGVTLIDTLIVKLIAANINPFKRIYNSIIDEGLHKNPKRFEEFSFLKRDPVTWPSWIVDRYKNKFGYGTASAGIHSRDNLYRDTLTRLAELSANHIRDSDLISEIAQLVDKNGRIDHPAKGHDDMVIAWLLNGWFLLHSRNLDYYGVTKPAHLAVRFDAKEDKKVSTIVDAYHAREENKLVATIKQLTNDLEACRDILESNLLETRIRNLSRRLPTDTIGSQTVDDLIKTAKDARHKHRKLRNHDMVSYDRQVA